MKILLVGEIYSTNLGDGVIYDTVKQMILTNYDCEIIQFDISGRTKYTCEDEKNKIETNKKTKYKYLKKKRNNDSQTIINEQTSIMIEYKAKKNEYQLLYGGEGLDFDDYRQVGAWYADKVTDEEVQRVEHESEREQKEEKLKELMRADEKLDEELSKVEEEKNR